MDRIRSKFTHIILLSSILMLLFSCAVSADGLSRKKATVYKKEKITLQLITGKTGKIKWSVSRKGIVKLKASGTSCLVTGKKTGSVKVTAKIGKKKYSCKVTVKKPPKYQVKACPFGKTSSLGNVVQIYDTFYVAVRFNNAKQKKGTWKWTCSDPSMLQFVSSSSPQRITYAVRILGKTGTVKVTARNGKTKASLTLTVVKRSDPVYFLDGKYYTNNGGGKLNNRTVTDRSFFVYVGSKYTDVPSTGWTWTSSNPNVVRINKQEGDFCRLESMGKTGSAVITGSRGEYSANYTINVSVSQERAYWNRYINTLFGSGYIGITNSMTPLYKSRRIAEWICGISRYQITDDPNHFDLLDSWAERGTGYGQCMHYAYLYQYLAEWAKIPTVYVSSEGANHAWNQTLINGSWFNVDVTNMDLDEYGFRYTGYFMVSDSAYGVYKKPGALYGRVGTVACTNQTYDSWTTNDWKNRITA